MPRKIVYEGVQMGVSPLPVHPSAPEGGRVLSFMDPVTGDTHSFPLPQAAVDELKVALSGLQPVTPGDLAQMGSQGIQR